MVLSLLPFVTSADSRSVRRDLSVYIQVEEDEFRDGNVSRTKNQPKQNLLFYGTRYTYCSATAASSQRVLLLTVTALD